MGRADHLPLTSTFEERIAHEALEKIILGSSLLFVAITGFGLYSWFNRELPPIRIDAPGKGGQRVMIGDLPANYYPAPGTGRHPAVILLGGSDGSLREFRNVYARALAAQGYAVIYPGYYNTREDNRSFNLIPLEGFDRVLQWLKARPEVDPRRIAIIGHSKGAEAALIVASRNPDIRAVVAAMPSDVVWQGFDFNSIDMSKFNSSWSIGGKPVPFVRYKLLSWYEWFADDALLRMYRQSWERAAAYPGAAIALGTIKGDVLLVCGGQDMVWPSCPMAQEAKDRLERAHLQHSTLLAYPDAGHWAFGPVNGLADYDKRNLGQLGGTAQADLRARADQWPKILVFLAKALSTS